MLENQNLSDIFIWEWLLPISSNRITAPSWTKLNDTACKKIGGFEFGESLLYLRI